MVGKIAIVRLIANCAVTLHLYRSIYEYKMGEDCGKQDQTVLEEKIEQVKKIRELVKGIVKNISGQYFYEVRRDWWRI